MPKRTKKQVAAKVSAKGALVDVTRKIEDITRLRLFVLAGGRCQFDSCNEYLLEHHVTLTEGNFAQMAHIVAFSKEGPRGHLKRPADINSVENLMVLCPKCHKLIDDHPGRFTKATLIGYKKQHEARIRHVTGLGPEQKTSVLIVKSKIGEQTVTFPFDQVLEAITPRYPLSREPFTVDLTQLPTSSDGFIQTSCDAIKEELRTFLGSSGELKKTGHVSLFALGTIPILAFLGSQLSNKIPLDLYQRHRDKENWTWKKGSTPVEYRFYEKQKGSNSENVALIMSLSGSIDSKRLPADIDATFSVYEITLSNIVPNPTFLKAKSDLEEFRNIYQVSIGTIAKQHPSLKTIHLFPAVPAPVAVLCGRELLPKVHPKLRVYDDDKRGAKFTYQLTVNSV